MALRLQSPTQNVDVWALPHPPGNSALVGVLSAWNSVYYNFQMVLRLVTNCSPKEVARLPDPESLVFLAQSPSLHTILLKTADWKMLTLRNVRLPPWRGQTGQKWVGPLDHLLHWDPEMPSATIAVISSNDQSVGAELSQQHFSSKPWQQAFL